jgi:hypothetical protein
MSGFGAYHVELEPHVDYIVSSANKNIEGVPGFAFGLCRRQKLLSQDHARTLSLDMLANWKGLCGPPLRAGMAARGAAGARLLTRGRTGGAGSAAGSSASHRRPTPSLPSVRLCASTPLRHVQPPHLSQSC